MVVNNKFNEDVLRENNIFTNITEFKNSLKTPLDDSLRTNFDNSKSYLVYAGQQAYLDYYSGVSSKVLALDDLSDENIGTFFLYLDTDDIVNL